MLKDSPGETIVEFLQKCPTGIQGLDEVPSGGPPQGRPPLRPGAAGSEKTLPAMKFLIRGGRRFDKPGALIVFER